MRALHEAHSAFLLRKQQEAEAAASHWLEGWTVASQETLKRFQDQEAQRLHAEYIEWVLYVAADIDYKLLCGSDSDID